jgi:inward rectifier potassium channel
MSAKPPHDWEVRIGQRRVLGRGLERRFLGDLFHRCMSISWPRLFAGFIFFALVINVFFSLAFYAVEGSVTGARAPGYWEIFFFTWQLLGTVSFGGFMPGNLYGQALATVEIMVGVGSAAVMTGLIFARFTRPQAHIVFAQNPVVGRHRGKPALTVRIANNRHNFLSDANAKLWLALDDEQREARRFHPLALEREGSPLFALSWSLFHFIDEHSPLMGLDAAQMERRRGLLVAIVSGHDENYGQEVRARHQWEPETLHWNHRYVDIITHPEPGIEYVDFQKFHETVPLDPET